jgi:hypothetical protein
MCNGNSASITKNGTSIYRVWVPVWSTVSVGGFVPARGFAQAQLLARGRQRIHAQQDLVKQDTREATACVLATHSPE